MMIAILLGTFLMKNKKKINDSNIDSTANSLIDIN